MAVVPDGPQQKKSHRCPVALGRRQGRGAAPHRVVGLHGGHAESTPHMRDAGAVEQQVIITKSDTSKFANASGRIHEH